MPSLTDFSLRQAILDSINGDTIDFNLASYPSVISLITGELLYITDTSPNNLTNLRVKALSRMTGGIIYAATYGGGVFKTTDGGDNWNIGDTSTLTNLNVVSLTIDGSGKIVLGQRPECL